MYYQTEIKRIGCDDSEFQLLVSRLDHELWHELREDEATYDQFNWVKGIQTAVIAHVNGKPAAIGCFKEISKDTVEIKRMFVEKEFRSQGVSKLVLNELEKWSLELGINMQSWKRVCILKWRSIFMEVRDMRSLKTTINIKG